MKDRFKQIRQSAGADGKKVSQSEFAAMFGSTRDAIANIELGRTEPSDTLIELICTKLKIRKEWLVSGEGSMHEIPAPTWQSDADLVTALLESESDPVASIVRSIMQAYIQMDAGERESAKKFALAILTEIKKDKGES